MFKHEYGNWVEYRNTLPGSIREYDCHFGSDHGMAYYEMMQRVHDDILSIIKQEHDKGGDWVLVTHGSSTSRMGATTARSQIRKLMFNKDSTPYIDRKRCIQHDSVFVIAIRKKK